MGLLPTDLQEWAARREGGVQAGSPATAEQASVPPYEPPCPHREERDERALGYIVCVACGTPLGPVEPLRVDDYDLGWASLLTVDQMGVWATDNVPTLLAEVRRLRAVEDRGLAAGGGS